MAPWVLYTSVEFPRVQCKLPSTVCCGQSGLHWCALCSIHNPVAVALRYIYIITDTKKTPYGASFAALAHIECQVVGGRFVPLYRPNTVYSHRLDCVQVCHINVTLQHICFLVLYLLRMRDKVAKAISYSINRQEFRVKTSAKNIFIRVKSLRVLSIGESMFVYTGGSP